MQVIVPKVIVAVVLVAAGVLLAQPVPGVAGTPVTPGGALFDQDAIDQGRIGPVWLGLLGYLLAGLVAGAAAAYLALNRSRCPVCWFFLGLALNFPVVLFLWCLPAVTASGQPMPVPAGLGKVPCTHGPLACPACRWPNHPGATECAHCAGSLRPAIQPETRRRGARNT